MKTVMKSKILLLVALALMCCALLAACGEKGGVSEIFVQKADMPRMTTYVQGQELNLHGGVLTVVVDGEATPVPLDNEAVTVTGYNKDQLGAQTLTVTYMDKTTTITVNVVPRAVAEGFETNYFVGDTYDNSKGKLRINKDDGTTATINLSSNEVTLKSFDSSTAGKATITVTYDGYDCSFDVTVYAVDSIRLTVPKRTKYASHETELSLSGGYLTVSAPSPSTFQKFVNLTPEMVSGYDPSQLTYENRDQVLKQTILVRYAGKEASFEIELAYSKVHLTEHMATQLAHIDWTQGKFPELTEAETDIAIQAIAAYMDLTPAERSLIPEDTMKQVLYTGTLALRLSYLKEMETFSKAFAINNQGYLQFVGASYNDLAVAVERLENLEDPFNYYAELQLQIQEELGDTPMLNGKVSDMVIAHSEETAQSLIDMFTYVMNLHDLMQEIPADWTVETLAQYEMTITNVASKILIGNYKGLGHNDMYLKLSSWREKNDVFEILYSYYCYIKPDGREDLINNRLWQILPMPGDMNTWYVSFMRALEVEQFLVQYETSNAFLYDTISFMYYYHETAKAAANVKEGNNQLYKDLYQLLECDSLFEANLTNGPRGYLYQMGPALESERVMEAWERYLILADILIKHPTATFDERAADFEAAFNILVDMAPSELYTFLSSVNFLYDATGGSVLVMDCHTQTYNTLMYLVSSYYRLSLPEEVFNCFCDLMVAMENYALYGKRLEAILDFKETMLGLSESYNALSQEHKAIFDTVLGKGYNKYMDIYTRLDGQPQVDVGQWEAQMEELKETLLRFDEVVAVILGGTATAEEKNRAVPVMIATYQKAVLLHKQLLEAGGDVSRELVARVYAIEMNSVNLDFYFCAVRELFMNFMISSGIQTDDGNGYMLWTLYSGADLRGVMAQIADLMWAEFKGQVYTGEDLPAIMAAVRAVSPADMNTFFILGVNQTYYAALERYFTGITEGAKELIPSLLRAEIAYAVYMNNPNEETLAGFINEFRNTVSLYEKLENKEAFDACLGEMYQIYLQHYQELNK